MVTVPHPVRVFTSALTPCLPSCPARCRPSQFSRPLSPHLTCRTPSMSEPSSTERVTGDFARAVAQGWRETRARSRGKSAPEPPGGSQHCWQSLRSEDFKHLSPQIAAPCQPWPAILALVFPEKKHPAWHHGHSLQSPSFLFVPWSFVLNLSLECLGHPFSTSRLHHPNGVPSAR